MRIQIFTDAWHPQVNGVVRTLSTTQNVLIRQGHAVCVVQPEMFSTMPCPTYHEIRLALNPSRDMQHFIEDFDPQAIHIATEGPIGWSARHYCLANRIPFSTAFHTRFPEYVKARLGLPRRWMYGLLRHFHRPARRVMVPTPSVRRNLESRGFRNLALWSRPLGAGLRLRQSAGPRPCRVLPRAVRSIR